MNVCPTCGAEWTHKAPYGVTTLVGYASPPGHSHNDNCLFKTYTCKNGHSHAIYIRRRCTAEGCEWVGKETCWCHTSNKVDSWPEAQEEDYGKDVTLSP